ncbi:hypothetical protein SESBI_37695 [Sesbania bispinosa]|nr:hypothetical protein SESBI_37695 [Sesbania bispinosa]
MDPLGSAAFYMSHQETITLQHATAIGGSPSTRLVKGLPPIAVAGDIIQLCPIMIGKVDHWEQKSGPPVSFRKSKSRITPMTFTLSSLEQFCISRNGRKGPAFLLPIIERERLSNERMILESGKIPCRIPVSSLCITEVNNEDAQYGTLMDVLTHSEVAAKFKCVVRVVAASPYLAEDLRSPDGTNRMRLTVEDPTVRIHAFVVAEDGVTL